MAAAVVGCVFFSTDEVVLLGFALVFAVVDLVVPDDVFSPPVFLLCVATGSVVGSAFLFCVIWFFPSATVLLVSSAGDVIGYAEFNDTIG